MYIYVSLSRCFVRRTVSVSVRDCCQCPNADFGLKVAMEEPIIRVEEGWGKGAAKVNSSAVGV